MNGSTAPTRLVRAGVAGVLAVALSWVAVAAAQQSREYETGGPTVASAPPAPRESAQPTPRPPGRADCPGLTLGTPGASPTAPAEVPDGCLEMPRTVKLWRAENCQSVARLLADDQVELRLPSGRTIRPDCEGWVRESTEGPTGGTGR